MRLFADRLPDLAAVSAAYAGSPASAAGGGWFALGRRLLRLGRVTQGRIRSQRTDVQEGSMRLARIRGVPLAAP